MNHILLAKAELRREILTKRKAIVQEPLNLLSNLLQVIELEKPTRVASYVSYPTEPDTSKLIEILKEQGTAVLIPSTLPDGLLAWRDAVTGEEVLLESGDLLFVPALAADLSGNRLGRGKGYFDRELEKLNGVITYAVVFEREVLPQIPVEAHDQRVQALVTQEQIYKII
jgi:5-formyltetrahydrofolate cyclo-ligase